MNYEDRYVVFLDILGFKNMVMNSENNPNLLEKINKILNQIQKIKKDKYSLFTESDRQISIFSDSIIISYSSINPGIVYPILENIICLCIEFSYENIWIRGGISFGKLYHKGDKCFGPALVNAINLESKHAKYARVVVDTDFLVTTTANPPKLFSSNEHKNQIMEFLKKDSSDNLYYLDFLDSILDSLDYPEDIKNTFVKIKNNITQSLISYKNNTQILEKYEWMKNYYNQTIEKNFLVETSWELKNSLLIQ
ncbi:hypothetical protein MVQ23_09880 [Fusobacterium necrophorum]|uniref:hypothetical protein n=1 Tax=Fusobacterium necrophorum TaxID=859 RepID=UPI002551A52D|nr:hypothetical protein [Fusobacterium necrophorum]MDK4486151.1 hypothetical protein [Fusobacterium necrophorum]